MTAAHKRRAAAREKASPLGHDGSRALTICLCFVLVIMLGIELGGSSWVPGRPGSAQLADDTLATGSIVLVPPSGNDCRLRQIDNTTWNITGNVAVDCQAALSNTLPRANGQRASHIDVIRDGFRNR